MPDDETIEPEPNDHDEKLQDLLSTTVVREALEEAIEQVVAKFPEMKGFLLIGWTGIFEFIDPDGKRWIIRDWGSETPSWVRDGYLFQSLYGGFND